jgi:hypothetical protein
VKPAELACEALILLQQGATPRRVIMPRRDRPRTPVLDAFLATLDDLRRSLL